MTMTQEIQTQPKPEPQKDENLDDALDALKRMIVARVSNGELKGFSEAERLCGVAQELRRAVAMRIGDLDENEYNNEGLEGDFGVIGAGRRRVRRARNVYQGGVIMPGNDHMEMQREALLAANREIDNRETATDAAAARDEARELAALAALPAEDRAAVEDRIALLKKRINERKKNNDNVVPTDDVRRHQAGEIGLRPHEAGPYGVVLG